jgi:hypothetical protein
MPRKKTVSKSKKRKEAEEKEEKVEIKNKKLSSSDQHSSPSIMLFAIIVLIVIAGIVFLSQMQTTSEVNKTMEKNQEHMDEKVSKLEETINSLKELTEETISDVDSQTKKMAAMLQLDSMEKYVDYILDPENAELYETEKPEDFFYVEENDDKKNIFLDDPAISVYAMIEDGWEDKMSEDIITMYLELEEIDECILYEDDIEDEDCVTEFSYIYYGPFSIEKAILE